MDYLHQCAIKIQKTFRGFMTRQLYKQLQQLLYYSQQTSQSQVIYTSNSISRKMSSKSPKPIMFEFDIYIHAALLIQKTFRGFLTRKYMFNYYKLKWAVRVLEQAMYDYHRKKLQQRKAIVKQLVAFSYSIQNKCRTIDKIKQALTKTTGFNQQSLLETDQILFDSFLTLFSKDYSRKSIQQKTEFQSKLKQFLRCPNSQNSIKENLPLRKTQITTKQFHQILMTQSGRRK